MKNNVNGNCFKARLTTGNQGSDSIRYTSICKKIWIASKVKSMSLACFVIFFNYQAQAQPATSQKTAAQIIDERKTLAKEFFETSGLKEELLLSIQFGDGYLAKPPKEKNPEIAAQNTKAYEMAKAKFNTKKAFLVEDLTRQMINELSNVFSGPELKYLIEVSKSSVFKRYNSFLKSDSFGKIFSTPPQMARALVDEAKKELSAPKKAPLKQ